MQSRNTRQAVSKAVFEVTSLCTNTGIEYFTADQLLRLLHSAGSQPRRSSPSAADCYILYWLVVDSFLHHSPNAIINRFNVRDVGRPHVGSNEFGSLATKQLHCLTCKKDMHFISNASDGWQQFLQ